MARKDCIDEIRAAAGRTGTTLSDAEIERMLDAVVRKAKRSSGIGALDSEGLRFAAAAMAEEARKAALIQKRNALIAMRERIARRGRIESRPDIGAGIQAEIRGIHTPTGEAGQRYSASARWHARERVYVDGLTRDLERAGLFKAMRNNRTLTGQWARELFELSKGKDGNPGISGSPEALTIAKAIHRYQNMAKNALNRAGGAIGDYAGYITRTSHDMDKIRRAGEAPWKDFVRPLLHADTFDYVGGPGTPESEAFLGNVYRALRTGVHLTHEGMQGFKDPAFTGPGNLAQARQPGTRVLHFKDADAWLDYHRALRHRNRRRGGHRKFAALGEGDRTDAGVRAEPARRVRGRCPLFQGKISRHRPRPHRPAECRRAAAEQRIRLPRGQGQPAAAPACGQDLCRHPRGRWRWDGSAWCR